MHSYELLHLLFQSKKKKQTMQRILCWQYTWQYKMYIVYHFHFVDVDNFVVHLMNYLKNT